MDNSINSVNPISISEYMNFEQKNDSDLDINNIPILNIPKMQTPLGTKMQSSPDFTEIILPDPYRSQLYSETYAPNIPTNISPLSYNYSPKQSNIYPNQLLNQQANGYFNQQANGYFNQQANGYSNQQPNLYSNQQPNMVTNQQANGYFNQQANGYSNQQPNIYSNQQPNIYSNQQSKLYSNQQPNMYTNQQPNGYFNQQANGYSNQQANGYSNQQANGYSNQQPNLYSNQQTNMDNNQQTNMENNQQQNIDSNQPSEESLRNDYVKKYSILQKYYPYMKIEDPKPEWSMNEIKSKFDTYVETLRIQHSIETNQMWLIIIWGVIQLVGVRWLGLPMDGCISFQLFFIKRYHHMLFELGKNSFTPNFIHAMPTPYKIIGFALFMAFVYVMIRLMIGDNGIEIGGQMINKAIDFFKSLFPNQNSDEGINLAMNANANSTVPEPMEPRTDNLNKPSNMMDGILNMFGGLDPSSLFSMLGTMIGDNEANDLPKKKKPKPYTQRKKD